MCGIAAILDSRGIEPGFEHSTRWTQCLASLRRRGPDGSGTWRSPTNTALLGHTRLAIVDPTTAGHQPLVAQWHPVTITYNGELYNAPDLRKELIAKGFKFQSHCDTEVLLNAWLCWGRGMLDKLLGMFAFAIWDDTKKALFAAVDHVGMKPIVWKLESDRLFLASDTDSIRALTGRDESLNPTALRHVLTMSCCPAPLTMWAGVYKLKGGHTLEWSPGSGVVINRYYNPPNQTDSQDHSESFDGLFERVVADHLIADVPVGAFLSGGLDSASILAGAVSNGIHPTCFTLEMEGEASEHDDARRVARHLGLDLVCKPIADRILESLALYASGFDEPQGYSALLTMVAISQMASNHVKSVIGGDGGDETFGGYLWQRETGIDAWQNWEKTRSLVESQSSIAEQVRSTEADDETRALARRVFGSHSFVHGYLSRVFPGFHPAEARAMTPDWSDAYDEETASGWLIPEDRPDLPHLRRTQRLDLLGFCPASILPKIDRGAMHFGLEIRSPMLDRRLIDRGLCAPVHRDEMLADGSKSRPDLRRYASTHLGDALSNRPKQGFSIRTSTELAQWRALAESIKEMKIVRSGVLSPQWCSFVPIGDMTRLRLVCMLGAWAEHRI